MKCCKANMYKNCCDSYTVPNLALRNRILQKFHGKKIALVGDSLTRQWFETLSCFLELSQPHWYPVLPSHLKKTKLKPMHSPPRGMKRASGYSHADGILDIHYFHYDMVNLKFFFLKVQIFKIYMGRVEKVHPFGCHTNFPESEQVCSVMQNTHHHQNHPSRGWWSRARLSPLTNQHHSNFFIVNPGR